MTDKDAAHTCPSCGGVADNGLDNCIPQGAYMCKKCCANEDAAKAALELAKECGIKYRLTPEKTTEMWCLDDAVVNYYNAARKPLEEEVEREKLYSSMLFDQVNGLNQQLLATQEAYQRVVEALDESDSYIRSNDNGGFSALPVIRSNKKAIANKPSLEAVERKKLEDEIVVLEHAECYHPLEGDYFGFIRSLIAERKAKLEKMNEQIRT